MPNIKIKIQSLEIDELINHLDLHHTVSFSKRTHGFWDRLTPFSLTMYDQLACDPILFKDMVISLATLKPRAHLYESLDFALDAKNRNSTLLMPLRVQESLKQLGLLDIVLCHQWYYGMFWRQSIIDGTLKNLLSFIKDHNMRVVVVGPKYLENLKIQWDIDNFHFIDTRWSEGIKYILAAHTQTRQEIYDEIMNDILRVSQYTLYLFQAPGIGHLIIDRTHRFKRNSAIFDVGRVLDIWCPDRLSGRDGRAPGIGWFFPHKDQIIQNMSLDPLLYKDLVFHSSKHSLYVGRNF